MWEVAQRVVQSRGFVRSKLLTHFLLFICEKQMLGEHDQLSEQQIGERVFRRASGYRPGEDNIVRNYARLLRQRLDHYFEIEGRNEPVRIVVPRGRYVPMLIEHETSSAEPPDREQGTPPTADEALEDHTGELHTDSIRTPVDSSSREAPAVDPQLSPPLPKSRKFPRSMTWSLLGSFCTILVLLAAWLLQAVVHARHPDPTSIFWSAFFNPEHDTIVVPGDDGLVIYEDLTHHTVSLSEYAAGVSRNSAPMSSSLTSADVMELGYRRYTSFVDLQTIAHLAQLPAALRGRMKIRYAREVSLDDLKQTNIILIGSLHANPWTELYQRELNFQFVSQPGSQDLVIRNRQPQPGEQSVYSTASDQARTTYGVIAAIPNLSGAGHVLLIEGINMAGTEAAAELLLLDGGPYAAIGKLRENGKVRLCFEVLVKTINVGANAPRPEVVAVRFGNRALPGCNSLQ